MSPESRAPQGQRPIDELNIAFQEFLAPNGIQNSQLGRNGEVGIATFYSGPAGPVVS